MDKTYKLKNWFSLDDAAKLLTVLLGTEVSVRDVLQFAIDGNLNLSWYMRHVYAQRVQKEIVDVDIGKINAAFNRAKGNVGEEEETKIIRTMQYTPLSGIQAVDGLHTLALEECGALKNYISNIMFGYGEELIALDGFIVEDGDGFLWQVMERLDDSYIKKENKHKFRHPENFCPSSCFPENDEIVISKKDIEKLEAKIKENKSNKLSTRQHSTYLRIIGALLDLLLGKSQAGNKYSKFNSQQEIINSIHDRHGKTNGLSKRNLEAKFAEAKQEMDIYIDDI